MKSSAGENFIANIDFDKENPVETFLINLKKYWDSFDVDSHAARWVSQRGKRGCPNRILDLVVDAEQIKDIIFKLWSALAGDVPFGPLGTRLSALLKEVNELVELTPLPEECSEKERQVFSDLARLQKSLISAGIAAEGECINGSRC